MNKPVQTFLFVFVGLLPCAVLADVGASWLRIPTSAEQAGLSGSSGALADDVDALGVNPAGLAELSGNQAEVLHNIWAQNLNVEHLAFGHGFENFGFALSADYFNFGQVDFYTLGTGGTPAANGSFNPMGLDLYGGIGFALAPGFDAGIEGKFILENLTSGLSSSTEAADMGLSYHHAPTGLGAGLTLKNLGGTLDGSNLPLSLDMAGSFTKRFSEDHQVRLGADADLSLNDSTANTESLGAEYWYKGTVAVRAGYRFAGYGNLQGLAGLSAGVGIKLDQVELNYALTTLGDLGSGSQISLGYRFGPYAAPTPSAPEGLDYDVKDDSVVLHWKNASDKGTAGFNFYIKKNDDEPFKKANGKPLVENSLTLKKMKAGKTYLVGVTAVNLEGRESSMTTLKISSNN